MSRRLQFLFLVVVLHALVGIWSPQLVSAQDPPPPDGMGGDPPEPMPEGGGEGGGEETVTTTMPEGEVITEAATMLPDGEGVMIPPEEESVTTDEETPPEGDDTTTLLEVATTLPNVEGVTTLPDDGGATIPPEEESTEEEAATTLPNGEDPTTEEVEEEADTTLPEGEVVTTQAPMHGDGEEEVTVGTEAGNMTEVIGETNSTEAVTTEEEVITTEGPEPGGDMPTDPGEDGDEPETTTQPVQTDDQGLQPMGSGDNDDDIIGPFTTSQPLTTPTPTDPGMLSSGSGGSGTLDFITCSATPTSFLSASIFAPLSTLTQQLGCQSSNSGTSLLFTITLPTRQVILSEQEAATSLIASIFTEGTTDFSVSVCSDENGACAPDSMPFDVGMLSVDVGESSDRLLPFGEAVGDLSFGGIVDATNVIYAPENIPLFSNTHRRIFISSNGLVSFDQQYYSWWPVPFPYGRSRVPVLAPLWQDYDFRDPSSQIFYNIYERSSEESLLERAVWEEFSRRLPQNSSFEAEWMTVVTWSSATPYSHSNEMTTFQLVLATDFIQTHAFFLYQDSTLNLPSWRRIVAGYDAKDFQNFHNFDLSTQQLTQLHMTEGNVDRIGEWYFNLTSPDPLLTSEQRCMIWAKRQEESNIALGSSSLQSGFCPCTRRQAQRDWRFWFAYYWGLSRQDCATVLFSRSQHTLECCYDEFGALIVGPSSGGGSYKLYNPLNFIMESYTEDVRPYEDCCVDSNRCRLYHQYRPSDDCSGYQPPNPQFTFGDPHFKTVDNQNYTFNGIGEYMLIATPPSLGFSVQARLQRFSPNVTGTVMSAVVIRQGDVDTLQVQVEDDILVVYIGGNRLELEPGDSPIVISSSAIFSNLTGGLGDVGDPRVMSTMADQLFLRLDSAVSLVVSTGEGASVSINLENGFLGLTATLPDSFINMTSGLLGVFNGDPDDDFRDRNGTVLQLDTESERDIYEQFGLLWHLTETESLFNYSLGDTSYSTINDGYLTYRPIFTDDVIQNVTDDVIAMCFSNEECIYDYIVTGSMEIGQSTYNIARTNDDISRILKNTPPVITGDFTMFAVAGVEATATFQASDEDIGDQVDTFTCLNEIDGFICTKMGNTNTIQIDWTNPGTPFPSAPLRLFANDSSGAPTIRDVSVVLCQCNNGGNCIMDNSTLETAAFDKNGYYQWPCQCSSFFSGASCEVDERGCGPYSVCPDYAGCEDDSTQESGYVCANCSTGYRLDNQTGKCVDMNECDENDTCSQTCSNTEGSFICSCATGYALGSDQRTCEDVNECDLETADCSPILESCTNTLGSYTCRCMPGYIRSSVTSNTCVVRRELSCTCGGGTGTDTPVCVQSLYGAECLCDPGQVCTGTCLHEADDYSDVLMNGVQNCEVCPDGMYGLRCEQMCSCNNNGYCNSTIGCVCDEGWTGINCNKELNDFTPSFDAETPARHQITWNLGTGAEILTIEASDLDAGPNATRIQFSLTSPPYPLPPGISDGTDAFLIDPDSGVISLTRDLTSLSGSVSGFVLTVTASDEGQPPRTATHMITVTPVPVPAIQTTTTPENSIDEETPLGNVVAELGCTETGPTSDSTQISLSGPGSQFFRIEKGSRIVVSRRIDYEALPLSEREFVITATCTNRYDQSDSITIPLAVNNLDDNPFKFEPPQYMASLLENVTPGEAVLTVRAFDRDEPSASIQYVIEQSEGSSDFQIIPHTGEIDVLSSLDREIQEVYRLTVTASYRTSENMVQSVSAAVTINIEDLNDEIPVFGESLYRIRNLTTRNNIGDLVVMASARDPDAGSNGQVTYQLQQDGSEFSINEMTGEIFINATLSQGLRILNVTATDGGENPQSSFALVYVYVLSSPSHILLTLSESPLLAPENVPVGSQIGQVNYEVIDDTNSTINETSDLDVRFEIVNGSDTDRFLISATTGEIFNLGTLDHDSLAGEYDLVVRASLDARNVQLVQEIVARIVVQNLNDNPPQFTPRFYATTVEQFTLPGTNVLTVLAFDPDQLSDITYSLADPDSSFFQINASTGVISAAVELDTPQDYRFSVVAQDGGAETSSATVFISVTRSVSVSPVFTRTEFVFPLLESATPGTFVGTVTALTRGNRSSLEFDHLGFRISMPDPVNFNVTSLNTSQSLFHIDQDSGNISTQSVFEFDLESRLDYVFYVEVFNVNNDSIIYDSATVEIQLRDVNDNPPDFSQSLYTRVINASQPLNSIVATVSASDRDSGDNGRITYSFEGQNVSLGFALDPASGDITVSNSTLIPGDYYLRIVASDGGDPSLTSTATIFIAVLPVIPTDITFTEHVYTFEVAENERPDTRLGTIQALDSNTSLVPTGIMYFTPNVTDCFSVDAQSGEVRLSCTSLDRDSVAGYELEIIAQVGTTLTRGTLRIDVLDINDNAPEFSLDVFTNIINDRYGTTNSILNLTASDADLGANGTIIYSLVSGMDLFRVDQRTGELFLINDTIEIGDYRLTVQATDMGTPVAMSSTALVLICVTRAHPQTLEFASQQFDIRENSGPNTRVGTVTLVTNGGNRINPMEFPNNLIFSITGGSGRDLFIIDQYTGILRVQTQNLDRETESSHVINILANFTQFSNAPIQYISGSFTINVLDVNDNTPVILTTYATTIDDSAVFGEVIFNITATDTDDGSNGEVSFNIDPQPSSLFGVRVIETFYPRTYGEIFVNDSDLLIPATYQFTLTASDNGEPALRRTAMVEIIVEHAIPEMIYFTSPMYTFSIFEEAEERTFTGNVSILPETPALDDLVFRITGGNGTGFFNINATTGEILKSHRRIDRERVTSFLLDIEAELPEQNPPLIATASVEIIIDDINDNSPRFTLGVYPSVGRDTDELNTTAPLARVSASDADIGPNGLIRYNIHSIEVNQSRTSPSVFVVNNTTGEIFAASVDIPNGDYLLNISASDQGQPERTSYASVTILIQLPAPTFVAFTNTSGYTFRLPENTPPMILGRVMLDSIPDYLLQYVSYTTQSSIFAISPSTGDIIPRRSFNYEVETSFSFEVGARLVVTSRIPQVDLSTVANVTVEIVDANDNPPFFINFPTEITQYEERRQSEVVHTFLANDSDSGSNADLRYSILSSEVRRLLTIDAVSGQLRASANLDREDSFEGRNHTVIVQVCDRGQPQARCAMQTTLIFRILDINDNAPRLTSGFSYDASERLPAETAVFSFVASDPDVGANSTIRYFMQNSSGVPFVCDELTGQVRLTEELDYEMQTSYNVTLTLRDLGTPQQSTEYTNLTIRVVNQPDNTPQFNQTVYYNTTGPTVSRDDVLFHMRATDADIGSSNDTLKYAITDIQVNGNNGQLPDIRIDEDTGELYAGGAAVYITESNFTISLLVCDQSRFNLSNTTTVVITVIPDRLVFTQPEYTATINEDATLGSLIDTLSIEALSASSNINYTFNVIEPVLPVNTLIFSATGNGAPAVALLLANTGTGLDREDVARYVIEVTASRPVNETTTTRLVVIVEDVNDNRPRFLDTNGTIVSIAEDAVTPTVVTQSNATDIDIGDNARLEYSIISTDRDLPFQINSASGVIQTRGVLDYERTRSYNVTVRVRDFGSPRLENRLLYVINIININDEFPQFAASAYFGEVYGGAAVNDYVLHTELRVVDRDYENINEQVFTFRIYQRNQVQQVEDYRFSVDSTPPYRIRVENLPDEADVKPRRLLELIVEVADEGNKLARVPLYISIFTSNNIAFFILEGVDEDVLLSCEVEASSMCTFRDLLAREIWDRLPSSNSVTFYNHSVMSQGNQMLMVEMYGWYGTIGVRESRGEISSVNADASFAVQYIEYDEQLFKDASESTRIEFLSFAVTLQEKPTPMTTTRATPVPADNQLTLLVGVGVGLVAVVLVVLMVIVLVCVFGRRRNQPKKKNKNRRPSDPYERSLNRYPDRRHKKRRKSSEDLPLHSMAGQSDLAYETMYDDDDIVDTAQTMPWFDPKYLAPDNEPYDGDTEHSLPRPTGERPEVPTNLRATVDGDARRGRRHSTDDAGLTDQSLTEMDQSEYLQGYQSSAPMQPGQRMGELDMFASPRDPDKPYRPSLEHAQNYWQRAQQEQQEQQMSQSSQLPQPRSQQRGNQLQQNKNQSLSPQQNRNQPPIPQQNRNQPPAPQQNKNQSQIQPPQSSPPPPSYSQRDRLNESQSPSARPKTRNWPPQQRENQPALPQNRNGPPRPNSGQQQSRNIGQPPQQTSQLQSQQQQEQQLPKRNALRKLPQRK